jgi:hypothetical protein
MEPQGVERLQLAVVGRGNPVAVSNVAVRAPTHGRFGNKAMPEISAMAFDSTTLYSPLQKVSSQVTFQALVPIPSPQPPLPKPRPVD